jgi:predicted membrane channel-forming protein YqfA (hemolysin III family)
MLIHMSLDRAGMTVVIYFTIVYFVAMGGGGSVKYGWRMLMYRSAVVEFMMSSTFDFPRRPDMFSVLSELDYI